MDGKDFELCVVHFSQECTVYFGCVGIRITK